MASKRLEDIFISMGLATEKQVEECRKEIAGTGKALHACLITRCSIAPDAVAKAYAEYASLDYIDHIPEKLIDLKMMGQVPLKFLRDNVVLPVVIDGNPVIVTANPLNFQPLDELGILLGREVSYAVAPASVIVDTINRYYPLEGARTMIEELEEDQDREVVDFEEVGEQDILTAADDAPIIKLVNHILVQAVKQDASDIHIEPFEKELRIRYRIDGVMYDVMTPPKRVQSSLSSRIKIMANLDIAEKRVPQDGRIQIKVADKAIDIRVSVLPVAHGERVVMRLLDKSRSFAALKELGLSERDSALVKINIARPNGIIYVTGPTGSGKTTTLYSILSALNSPEVNIITVEDPVEYQMAGIGQVQVREKTGLTFVTALRSILRQDPDIIMIGETRDEATAQIAIQAALTGHLVLSTLHTNNAPAAITRLIDMGVEPFLIASTVKLVLAQRLVRRICTACRQEEAPPMEALSRFGLTAAEVKDITFYKPVGCEVCMHNGYKGRLPIFEVMEISEKMEQATMQRVDTGALRKIAVGDGMIMLLEDGLAKVKQGLTTLEEVLSVAAVEQGGQEE